MPSKSTTQLATHQFKQLVEHLPMPVAMFDQNMNYVFANTRWITDFYLDERGITLQNIIGRNHYKVFPHIEDAWREIHEKCLMGDVHYDHELAFPREDSAVVWLRREIRPWYDAAGQIGGLIIYVENITERKHTEEALTRQHRFLRHVIDLDTSFIFAKDRHGRFTLVNKALADAYSSTPEDMVGKFDEDFNPNRIETEQFKKDDLAVINSRQPRFISEEPVTHVKDRETRWYQTIKIPLLADDDEVQLLGIATDITDRKRAQDELRAQHRFLRQIIDLNTSFIFAKDSQGSFTLVNKALADVYGSRPEDMVGKTDAHFNPDPTQVQSIRHDDLEVLHTRQPKFIPEEPITHAYTGETRWYQTTKIPFMTDAGEVYLLGIATDITEHKQTQEKLKQLVGREQEARQAAEAASRMKDLFLANMSHELRTPLHAIIGFLREILYSQQLNTDNQHMAERCLANSKRLETLINSVLDLSRLEMGNLELIAAPVNLRQLVQVIAQDTMLQTRAKNLQFAFTIDPKLPEVIQHDDERLLQIISNLLGNAIKYTELGTVVLKLSLDRVRQGKKEQLIIEVSDTGIGIPPDMHQLVFESFTQGERGKQKQGVGLGLAIVKNLVELMQGQVQLDSQLGQYTVITVTLPLHLAEH